MSPDAHVLNRFLKRRLWGTSVQAIDQFAKSNLDHVRNRTGFFMSIIRRVKEEARGFSGGGRGGGRGGGGRYDDRYSLSLIHI